MTLILPLTRPEVLLACAAAPLRGHDEIGGAAATVASVLDAGLYTPTGCVFSFRSPGTTTLSAVTGEANSPVTAMHRDRRS